MEVRQVLALAVEKEQAAADLYAGMARQVDDPALRELLADMAAEESGHGQMLRRIDPGDIASFEPGEGESLGLAEFLEARPLSPEARLQEVLVHAMSREREAEAFYSRMAERVHDPALSDVFGKLARMESLHKVRLEETYESMFLSEN